MESVVFGDGTRWGASEFALARIHGNSNGNFLYGRGDWNDIFDSNAGGNDWLYGFGGDDVYYLGVGTGRDEIHERASERRGYTTYYRSAGDLGDAGDEIRVKSGVAVSSVTLERGHYGVHLYVQLRDTNGVVTDQLKVVDYYKHASARVESVVFGDGTRWGASEFALARIYGDSGGNSLYGRGDWNDVFDSNAGGNDRLHGFGGNDVYYLGVGTGMDEIHERASERRGYTTYYRNADDLGDTDDEIRVKSGFAESQVSLARVGNDLMVKLMNADGTATTDSLRVKDHFSHASAKVEKIRAGGKVLTESNYLSLINEIAAFNGGTSTHATMSAVLGAYWQDDTALTTPA